MAIQDRQNRFGKLNQKAKMHSGKKGQRTWNVFHNLAHVLGVSRGARHGCEDTLLCLRFRRKAAVDVLQATLEASFLVCCIRRPSRRCGLIVNQGLDSDTAFLSANAALIQCYIYPGRYS